MKYILLIAGISLFITSCSKELSDEWQDHAQGNLVIDDEKGGLNFFLYTTGSEISLKIYHGTIQVPVNERTKYFEYEVSATDLQDNIDYTIELQFHTVASQGTFAVMVEGFTASAYTKNFLIDSLPVSINDVGTKRQFLKMTRRMDRYTFTPY